MAEFLSDVRVLTSPMSSVEHGFLRAGPCHAWCVAVTLMARFSGALGETRWEVNWNSLLTYEIFTERCQHCASAALQWQLLVSQKGECRFALSHGRARPTRRAHIMIYSDMHNDVHRGQRCGLGISEDVKANLWEVLPLKDLQWSRGNEICSSFALMENKISWRKLEIA